MSNPSTMLQSRAWVEVDLGALKKNILAVSRAAPGCSLLPMVKADAYGLGMIPIAEALRRAVGPDGPWGFGVAAVAEGEALRRSGWSGRILVFAPAPPNEFGRAARADLTLCLSDLDGVRRWAEVARDVGRRLPFHLEIDTGMGRAGLLPSNLSEWGSAVSAASGDLLQWEGCFTHFHSADEPDLEPTDLQLERFRNAVTAVAGGSGGVDPSVFHCANSAASVRKGALGMDLVRPGIFLYGGSAGPGPAPLPVASVRARVGLVKEVPPGATVGYGATYAARTHERWGTLAIGYGDGIPRALSPAGGHALLHGVRVPIIGRISMDMTVVDVTSVPAANADDVATLIGRDGDEEILLDEVAAKCGTISYEILTGLGGRLPRVYKAG